MQTISEILYETRNERRDLPFDRLLSIRYNKIDSCYSRIQGRGKGKGIRSRRMRGKEIPLLHPHHHQTSGKDPD
jgi:hypothetical protein